MTKVLGGIVVAAGIILWCGNVFGFFPTFPMVGWGTVLLGGWIYRAGDGEA